MGGGESCMKCHHPYLYTPLQLWMWPTAAAQHDTIPFNTTMFLSVFYPIPTSGNRGMSSPHSHILSHHWCSDLPQWTEAAVHIKPSLPRSMATFSCHFPFAKYVWPTRHSQSLLTLFSGEVFRVLWSVPYSSCCESRMCRFILQQLMVIIFRFTEVIPQSWDRAGTPLWDHLQVHRYIHRKVLRWCTGILRYLNI